MNKTVTVKGNGMIKIIVNNTVQYYGPEEEIKFIVKKYEELKANAQPGDEIFITNDLGRVLKYYRHGYAEITECWTLLNNPLLSYERVERK